MILLHMHHGKEFIHTATSSHECQFSEQWHMLDGNAPELQWWHAYVEHNTKLRKWFYELFRISFSPSCTLKVMCKQLSLAVCRYKPLFTVACESPEAGGWGDVAKIGTNINVKYTCEQPHTACTGSSKPQAWFSIQMNVRTPVVNWDNKLSA